MANLNISQLVQLARQVGFPEQAVPDMAATWMGESGGNPRAHNNNRSTGDNSYGIGQVNVIDELGEERRKQFGLSRNEDLFDPLVNAKASRTIWDSQGFDAWGAHRSGAYKQYLAAAQAAARGGNAQPIPSSPSTTAAATSANSAQPGLAELFLQPQTTDVGSKRMASPEMTGRLLSAALLAGVGLQAPAVASSEAPVAEVRPQRFAGSDTSAIDSLIATAFGEKTPALQSTTESEDDGFKPVEYLTGDRSHAGFRDDHSGGNYHEHLAFSTKQERDDAMAKLKAGGIQIGSINSGRHAPNSYHYADLAFDVPASQVPVGQEQELSRRVRSILKIR